MPPTALEDSSFNEVPENIIQKKGNLFVKRLVDRKKENNKSPVNRVQSVQRRISIIKAIKKSEQSNKNNEQDMNLDDPHRNEADYLPPMNSPVKNTILTSDSPRWDQDQINSQVVHQSRFSVGEYFGAKSQKELLKNFYNSMDESQPETDRAEFYRRESQKFFNGRVLSVIEPEVEHQDPLDELKSTPSSRRHSRDMLFIQQALEKSAPLASLDDSSSTLLDTSHVRESEDSEERWTLQRRNVDGGIYQNFTEAVNTDFYQYNRSNTPRNYDDRIVETPVKPYEMDRRTPISRPTAPPSEFQDEEHSPTMSYFEEHRPIHESTRKYYDRNTPSPKFRNSKRLQTPSDIYYTARREDSESNVLDLEDGDKKVIEPPVDEVDNPNESYLETRSNNFYFTNSPEKTHLTENEDEISPKEELDEDKTPPLKSRAYIKKIMPEESMSKMSSTLNHTRSLCRTLTRRFTQSFLQKNNKSQKAPSVQLIPTDLNPTLKYQIRELLAKAEVEQARIYQASKAVDACKSSSKFMAGPERIESERLMTWTRLSKQAILNEIQKLASHHVGDSLYCERGKITISEISLPVNEDRNRLGLGNGEMVEWFMVIVSSGPIVWASHAVACSSSSRIFFPESEKITISDLDPDFRVTVTVYSLPLKKIEHRHEDKYGIKLETSSRTEKFAKALFFKKARDECTRRSWRGPYHHYDKSTFEPCGNVELTLVDLKSSDMSKTLSKVPSKSVLQGTIRLKLQCELQLTVAHAGFINYACHTIFLTGTNEYQLIRGVDNWNRRWCMLKDQSLLFWNYPREQEEKSKLGKINLGYCVSTQVVHADRSICPRRRTLFLETCPRRDQTGCGTHCAHIRHFLSFDTTQDQTEWQSKLNHVLASLQQWNVIRS